MKKLSREFYTSLFTVILAILAIAVFIYSGGSILFYAVVAMAILVGLYNILMISRSPYDNEGQNRRKRK